MTAPVKCNVTSTVTQQDPQKETTKDFYKTCNLPPRWDRPCEYLIIIIINYS